MAEKQKRDKSLGPNKNGIRLWIARDESIYNEDYEVLEKGKLHLFYDTPLVHRDPKTNILKFDCARCIGEIPSYMYPWLKEGDCFELNETHQLFNNYSKVNNVY